MKDLMMIWNQWAGRRFSTISISGAQASNNDAEESSSMRPSKSGRRKSSIVVNQFFNAALPVHLDGRARWPRSILILMILGLVGIMSGCFVVICQPYEFLFKLKVLFSDGGETFELWRKPPVDLYLKVYLFNFTNHEEYLAGKHEKLRVQEIGPYVYKEYFEHSNITFNTNGTLTTVSKHPLEFIPEMSNGTEEDLLILPNIALLSITNVMREASYFSRLGLNLLIRQTGTRPLVKMTAREFMFGYQSTLVTLGNNFMPSWIKFDKLGLIDRMYDFDGDFETVYTGESDIRLAGLIDKYKGSTDLPQWTGKCAKVQGSSDGVKFPGYLEPNRTIRFFRKSLCRSALMYPVGEKVVKGLNTFHYKFVENELDNGKFNPDNKCFCRQGFCLQAGLMDVTNCYYGFPIALSYPHFFKSDPSLLDSVEGLKPNPELHESYFYIQPKSGLPVDLSFRFQINMALQNIGHMAHVEKFDNLVLPLLWFEIGMYELPEAINNRFVLLLNILPTMEKAFMYGAFIFGGMFLSWSIAKILLHRPDGSNSSGQWLEIEMQKKRLGFLNERRASLKSKEKETYYSSLLSPKENGVSAELEDMPYLQGQVV